MISPDDIRKLLAAADPARDPYGVAGAAVALLTTDPSDTLAADCYARALGLLKLSPEARRPIPWTSRARRFAANLAALEKFDPNGAVLLRAAAAQLAPFELHQAADGNFQILDTRHPFGWLGGLADHKAAISLLQFDRKTTPLPAPVAFDGLGYGWLLTHLLDTTANSLLNYSCAVYILEPDPLALAMLLHMHDLQGVIASPRVRWFIHDQPAVAQKQFTEALRRNTTWTLPERFVRCHLRQRPALDLEPAITALRNERTSARDALVAQTASHYGPMTLFDWQRRFDRALAGTGEPLRILGITSRYTTVLQHSIREWQSAVLAVCGDKARFDISIESDDQSLENPFIEKIAAFRPDLIVQISRMRYENPCAPRNVPFLTWDQDNLPCMRTDAATASLDALTYVAGHGAFHGYVYLGWPRRNVIPCQPAAATHRYAPRDLSPAELDRYRCDLCYVSNASGSAADLREQLSRPWRNNPHTEALFLELTDAVLARGATAQVWTSPRLYRLLGDLQKRRGIKLAPRAGDEMVMNAVTIADRAFRHEVLGWAADLADAHGYSLRLYGNGWDRHPRLAKYAAGTARQGDELAAICRASKINLQIIETGFLHSRALDGIAAGGFFLTRRTDYDGLDTASVQARHNLSLHIRRHAIKTIDQLENATEKDVRDWWLRIRQDLQESSPGVLLRPNELLRGLELFSETPAACIIFPQFDQIAFTDRDSFSARVQRFLADDALRQKFAADMRQVVLDHFSYDARWKQFLTGIQAGLAASEAK